MQRLLVVACALRANERALGIADATLLPARHLQHGPAIRRCRPRGARDDGGDDACPGKPVSPAQMLTCRPSTPGSRGGQGWGGESIVHAVPRGAAHPVEHGPQPLPSRQWPWGGEGVAGCPMGGLESS